MCEMIESSMVKPWCCLEGPKISLETRLLFDDIGVGVHRGKGVSGTN